MQRIETVSLHPFGDQVLLEFVGTGETGEIATETIEFDVVDPNRGAVAPRQTIPPEYDEQISSVLSENGYSLA